MLQLMYSPVQNIIAHSFTVYYNMLIKESNTIDYQIHTLVSLQIKRILFL